MNQELEILRLCLEANEKLGYEVRFLFNGEYDEVEVRIKNTKDNWSVRRTYDRDLDMSGEKAKEMIETLQMIIDEKIEA